METPRPETPRPEPPPTAAAATAMASPTPLPSPAFLAFAGSSEQDVTLAKSFWNSVTLQPPLESRLGPRRDSASCPGSRKNSRAEMPSGTGLQCSHTDCKKEDDKNMESSVAEESGLKEQYIEKGKKREEILALLKKQRSERLAKELVSDPYKPKTRPRDSEIKKKLSDSDIEDQASFIERQRSLRACLAEND